jgi:uncharacterized protein (TIGR02145 family)
MKKAFLLFAMACFAFAGVLAQNGEIANLQVSQRTDGSGLVDIYFDLNGTGASYNLQFEASFDDGANYEPLSANYLTGDLNEILPGTGKHIIWDGKTSHPETFSTQTRVRVIAIEYIPPTAPTVITIEVTDITSTSATSGGNVTDDGGASVTVRGVLWSATPNPTLDENEGVTEDGEGLGEFMSEINGLQSGLEYFVRAYAINNIGLGYGDVIEFSTNLDGLPCPGTPTIADIDGNVYNTVLIGNQCWMAENLKTTYYSNGYPITYPGNNNSNWQNNNNGAYAWYNNSITWKDSYGALYNWYAVNSSHKLCPTGWHIPQRAEWEVLLFFLGGEELAGPILKTCRQVNSPLGGNCATSIHPRFDASQVYGTDDLNFSGLPGGRRYNSGNYDHQTQHGNYWGADEYNSTNSYLASLSNQFNKIFLFSTLKNSGLSVRCIRSGDTTLATIVTNEVTDITMTTAKSGGVVLFDGIADVIQRGIIWSTAPNPTVQINEGITIDGAGMGDFESNMTELELATTYFLKAYAINDKGIAYGQELSFKTDTIFVCGLSQINDIEENIYNTVLIGNQCWMKENLKTTKYRNGNYISYPGSNNTTWANNTCGAYAWYANDDVWRDIYGALYNWHAVNSYYGLCPNGWHVPSDDEWSQLIGFIGGSGSPSGNKLKSCRQISSPLGGDCNTFIHPRWVMHSTNYGTDEFGFSALPGGARHTDGNFYDLFGTVGQWWSSTQVNTDLSRRRFISYSNGNIGQDHNYKKLGLSVRCIKD